MQHNNAKWNRVYITQRANPPWMSIFSPKARKQVAGCFPHPLSWDHNARSCCFGIRHTHRDWQKLCFLHSIESVDVRMDVRESVPSHDESKNKKNKMRSGRRELSSSPSPQKKKKKSSPGWQLHFLSLNVALKFKSHTPRQNKSSGRSQSTWSSIGCEETSRCRVAPAVCWGVNVAEVNSVFFFFCLLSSRQESADALWVVQLDVTVECVRGNLAKLTLQSPAMKWVATPTFAKFVLGSWLTDALWLT